MVIWESNANRRKMGAGEERKEKNVLQAKYEVQYENEMNKRPINECLYGMSVDFHIHIEHDHPAKPLWQLLHSRLHIRLYVLKPYLLCYQSLILL